MWGVLVNLVEVFTVICIAKLHLVLFALAALMS